jgi:hypothetical protein
MTMHAAATGPLSPRDRHALAVRQALRWAEQAAGTGDYERALRALRTIERVDGQLPAPWQERRRAWTAAVHEQAGARRPRARGRRPY